MSINLLVRCIEKKHKAKETSKHTNYREDLNCLTFSTACNCYKKVIKCKVIHFWSFLVALQWVQLSEPTYVNISFTGAHLIHFPVPHTDRCSSFSAYCYCIALRSHLKALYNMRLHTITQFSQIQEKRAHLLSFISIQVSSPPLPYYGPNRQFNIILMLVGEWVLE